MAIIDRAYTAIREHSIIWADPVIRAQVIGNYKRAKQLDTKDPLKQIATLIENVAANCLFLTTNEGEKITPWGSEKNVLAPCVRVQITEKKTTLTLTHFEKERTTEWDGLLSRMNDIKACSEIVIDLRGNSGKNWVIAYDFLCQLLGQDFVKSCLHNTYRGAIYRWRVSDLNLKTLQSMDIPWDAYRRHRDDVVEKMSRSQELVVTTRVPDYEVPEKVCNEPDFKGNISLIVDENTKGCAQTLIQVLENCPHINIEGSRSSLHRFGEILKVEIAAGIVFHIPRKEEILASA